MTTKTKTRREGGTDVSKQPGQLVHAAHASLLLFTKGRRILTFEVLEQIGYGVSFVVEKKRLIVGISRGATSAATADVTHGFDRVMPSL